jgi:cytochrome oxidase Cu insertion factor (SCO1/SenC/PrrC family)
VSAKASAVLQKIAKTCIALVILYVVLCGALFAAMLQSPDRFAATMKHVPWPAFAVLPFKPMWDVARKGSVNVGELAPDFSLESPDHKDHFQLSSLRGEKPVVLVFGSYT